MIPNITFPENPVTGVLDDTITLTCPVTGSPTPSVSWRLPNGNTPPGNPTELTVGPPLSVANEGNYTCVTENSAGSVNKSLELQIRGESTFIITVRYGLYICAVKVNVLSRQSENFSVPILCFCMRTKHEIFS